MTELNPLQKKTKIYLVSAFFILATIFLVGIFWLASTPVKLLV